MEISDKINKCETVGMTMIAIFLLLCLNIGLVYYALPTSLIVLMVTMMLWGVYIISKRKCKEIHKNYFGTAITIIVFVTYFLEVWIVNKHPFDWATDPMICKSQAIYMHENWTLRPETEDYFRMYPNNINVIIMLGALYRIFGNYMYVIYFFLMLVNLSSVFTCLTVKNLTQSRGISLFVLVLLQLFCILTTRTYMPYTSNLAILFPILLIYIYTSRLNAAKKIILIPFVAMLSYQAKLTGLIPFIAIAVVEFLRIIKCRRVYFKYSFAAVISTILFFCIGAGVQKMCWDTIDYQQDETRYKDFAYFFYLGQNNASGGQWDELRVEAGDLTAPKAERDAFYYSVAFNDIKERGILGNFKFYIAKTAICWGCVKMDYIKPDPAVNNIIYVFRHCIWYFAFTCAMLSIFFCRTKSNKVMALTLTGVMVYLFLSEGSFTYVIMFSPIIFVMSGVGIKELTRKWNLVFAHTHQ